MDAKRMDELISRHDVTIHVAGPFQRVLHATLLMQICVRRGVRYMDVCDDLSHASACKDMDVSVKESGGVAWISTGVYPGLSNLMAAFAAGGEEGGDVKFYYHTAGTGGIGATVLASTFLLLSERAIVYEDDMRVMKKAAGDVEQFDFAGRIGVRDTYLLNLPEVTSIRDNLKIRNVCAKFSTAPGVWNFLLRGMARWTPTEWLRDRDAMLRFANFSMPVVRGVDMICGARTGIVVVAVTKGKQVCVRYEHESLARCVGESTAAFANELIHRKQLDSGVWYPEELAVDTREKIVNNATTTCNFYTVT